MRPFSRRSSRAGVGTSGRRSALLILGLALLSGIASGQVPTVTALPYVLTDQAGVIRIVTPIQVAPVPPAVSQSQFSSLLGGGFAPLLMIPTAATGTAVAIATVHKLLMIKAANYAKKQAMEFEMNGLDYLKKNQSCLTKNSALRVPGDVLAAMKSNHRLVADSSSCMLSQEEEAQHAEEDLQSLEESEQASQEAIEGAEEAAEAAEAAAESAEEAAEIALDGIDAIEALLDCVDLF
jgi:hypothetical protein